MALQKPSPRLLPDENYRRFGLAFDGVDANAAAIAQALAALSGKQPTFDLAGLLTTVSGLATKAALASEALTREMADAAEAQARQAADSAEALARQAGIADAVSRIARINAGLYPVARPGDNPNAFTAVNLGGDPDALPPLDLGVYPIRITRNGLGAEISGSREVWERTLHAVESGRLYQGRWRYERTRPSQDPSGDSVVALVQWYGADRTTAIGGPITVDALAPSIGVPHEYSAFIGTAGETGITVGRPSGAVYVRVGLKSYGVEARTVLTDLHVADVSAIEDAIRRLVPNDALPALSARIDDVLADLTDLTTKTIIARDGSGTILTDALGRTLASVGAEGLRASAYNLGDAVLRQVQGFAEGDVVVTDRFGRVSRFLGPRENGQDFSDAEVRGLDNRASADSAHLRLAINTATASIAWLYTAVLVYGQSLGQGWETWPVKTLTSRPDVLMLGQSVRPGGSNDDPNPSPAGDAVLRPAVATVQRTDTGAFLSPAEQAALAPGSLHLGEEPGLLACQFAKYLQLQARNEISDDRRTRLVVLNTAVGGQTIERLSKGATPDLFNRNRVLAQVVKNVGGASSGLGAVLYFGNEYNYDPQYGGTTDRATLKTKYRKLRTDLIADVAQGIFGQSETPAVITYQTSGSWTNDASDMSMGMALYELSLEEQGWYLAAPSYPVTDKGGHLDANGCRWLACQIGKVLHQTMTLRRPWRPTGPLSVLARGRTVLASFHTPSGTGLQFRPSYVGNSAVTYDARGFTVIDAVGTVKIVDVQITAPRVVRLTLGRAVVGQASLYYGRQTEAGGGGNLCDSDPTLPPFNYEYQAGSGDYASANIPDLVGKPYPLWNWCVAFKAPITQI